MKVEERLLKYVGYHTTSDEASDKIPSSDREFALARELESELKELGLSKVVLTDHCYVYGLLPATAGMEHKKAVGFIAHMDTAPDFSGENVKPQLLRHYDGSEVLLSLKPSPDALSLPQMALPCLVPMTRPVWLRL